MKKVSILLAFISGIALMAIISWKNNNEDSVKQDPENRPIIALRKIKLKAGVSAEAFEKFAIKAKNDEYCKLPGLKIYFGKGERGDEPDSYVYFLEFDSKATRDFYVPQEDDISKSSADAKKFVDIFSTKFVTELNKVADITIGGQKGYTNYIILQ